MNLILVAATVAVVSTSAIIDKNGATLFYDNQHIITFSQPVATQAVEMVDSTGCTVSKSSKADGEKVVVQMQACSRMGHPPGVMKVKWTVNGETGEYELILRKHH